MDHDKDDRFWVVDDFLPDTPASKVGSYVLFGTLGEGSSAK